MQGLLELTDCTNPLFSRPCHELLDDRGCLDRGSQLRKCRTAAMARAAEEADAQLFDELLEDVLYLR